MKYFIHIIEYTYIRIILLINLPVFLSHLEWKSLFLQNSPLESNSFLNNSFFQIKRRTNGPIILCHLLLTEDFILFPKFHLVILK